MRLPELDVLSGDLARRLAPIAGFRNVLVHGYAGIDWDEVYGNFGRLSELQPFAGRTSSWIEAESKGESA